MENLPFLGITSANRGISPVYEQKTGGIGVSAPIEATPSFSGLYQACERLSVRDGRSPDVSGGPCGRLIDIGKDGSIDNCAWG